MRPTIYLVDDDEDILEFYMSIFQEEEGKFDAKPFNRVEKVLEVIDAGALPDVFLVDIMMPGIDGIAFTELLHERGIRCPVIVISGFAQKEHAIRALNVGAFAMLEKPVSLNLVMGTTLRALAFYRALTVAEALLERQEGLISNLERIKNNYEDRLIDIENEMIAIKGHLTHEGLGGLELLKRFKEDRVINAVIQSAKEELAQIKENFAASDMWR